MIDLGLSLKFCISNRFSDDVDAMWPKDYTLRTSAPGCRLRSPWSFWFTGYAYTQLSSESMYEFTNPSAFVLHVFNYFYSSVEVFFIYLLAINFLLCDD